MKDYAMISPTEIRELISKQEITGPTAGMSKGFTQANLVILKKEHAFDFLLFCQRNPKPCPLLDVTEPGSFHPSKIAKDADIRRIFRNTGFTKMVSIRTK